MANRAHAALPVLGLLALVPLLPLACGGTQEVAGLAQDATPSPAPSSSDPSPDVRATPSSPTPSDASETGADAPGTSADARADARDGGSADGGVDAVADSADGAATDAALPAPRIPASLLGRVVRYTETCESRHTAWQSLHCNIYETQQVTTCDAQVEEVGTDVRISVLGNCTVANGPSSCTMTYGSPNCLRNCACPPNHPLSKPGSPPVPTPTPPTTFTGTYTPALIGPGIMGYVDVASCTTTGSSSTGGPYCPGPVDGMGGIASYTSISVNSPSTLRLSWSNATGNRCPGGTPAQVLGPRWRIPKANAPIISESIRCTAQIE